MINRRAKYPKHFRPVAVRGLEKLHPVSAADENISRNFKVMSDLTYTLNMTNEMEAPKSARLEQLRHQASVEKELLTAGTLRKTAEPSPCCPPNGMGRYAAQSPCSFLSSAAAAIFHNVTYVHGSQL
ncbi:hypothetical protein NQ317_009848 [Molorchus minor]|uniref:Uncharacterized protein n=1 Tax=Molorchus minor TaxID=1323400 RepID=A0ABQ9K236_9CUCU|nr:hypothetical protein NQ317_009848 [Molorchus minor]